MPASVSDVLLNPHPSVSAALVSISALAKLASSVPESLASEIDSLLMCSEDRGNLFWREPLAAAASGASVLHAFQIAPGDRYIELTSAIVRDGYADVSCIRHSWPILSLGDRTPSVADAGSASNAPGGGLS